MDELVSLLKNGQLAVVPTDTIYGIVGSALNRETVEKIYTLRKRQPTKPMIVLISSIDDLKLFAISLKTKDQGLLASLWPNPVSIILPCDSPELTYLHRGTSSLAFRMPKNKQLLELLRQTGPLVAPSANFEGESASKTIEEAKNYFGDDVSFYLDKGKIEAKSSTLLRLADDRFELLRQGAFKVPRSLRISQI